MYSTENQMIHYSSASPFVHRLYGRRISDEFSSIYGAIEVELGKNSQSQLCIRAFSVGDWCFSRIQGAGYTSFRNGNGASRFADHAFLVLTLGGQPQMLQSQFKFPPVGEIALGLWEDDDVTFSDGEFDYLCVNIPLAQLIPFGSVSLERAFLDTRRGAGAVIKATLLSLMKQSLGSGSNHYCNALLPAFANLIMTALATQNAPALQQGSPSRRLAKILKYLERHYTDPDLSPDQVAKVLGLSRRQFTREFQQVGETYTGQVRKLRLNMAKDLLYTRPDLSITHISFDCGFNSVTDFGRNFRKVYGVSPKEFRTVTLGPDKHVTVH